MTAARRVVVKIGSALLVDRATGALRSGWLHALAADVADLRARGVEVALVSSGSIALGRGVLGLGTGLLPLERAQAAAAVGQIHLARAYQEALAPHGITAAQVLVTLEDGEDRRRYLNQRATLGTLLSLGAVPIVNENDTVATDEIRYGDNDRLAARVAVTLGADLLVLLSDVDGLYTADPTRDASARRLDVIDAITAEIEGMAGDAGTGLSKGGMRTKVMAARMATDAGCVMIVTQGAPDGPLGLLAAGAPATLFRATSDPQAARKAWIGAMVPRGTLSVDEGAIRALAAGSSLLPAGIRGVEGTFGRGDPVAVAGPDGRARGLGLTRYTAREARAIMGLRSADIPAALGYEGRAAAIHRDDLVMQGGTP
ncbi:MAG: glutamate 5-kinase [Paracoccaceae bacterium]